ncbi:MAG: YihY family inner membrane protein [Pseudomonas sp.]
MPRRIQRLVYFCRYLLRRFGEDNCPKNAAALTYTTLFAVVPVMTVTYAMLAAIPAFNEVSGQIEGFIFDNFVPSTGAALRDYLSEFSQQARQLTGIGVALLMVTAFLMLVNIEKSFNAIWRIRQPRRGVSSFLLYWAVLSLGPLLLGAGFVVSTYLASLSFLTGDAVLASAWKQLLGWLPLLLSIAAFTLIFVAVPNTRVRLQHGLAGGVLVALLFEGAKACFALYVALFPSFQLIYGAFAAFPLFLLWIYVSWLIILFGAELVCNLGSSVAWQRSAYPWLVSLLSLLRIFMHAQKDGRVVDLPTVNATGWPMPEDLWLDLTEWMEGQRYITRAQQGGYVLSRDPEQLDMSELLEALPYAMLRISDLPVSLGAGDLWYPPLREALSRLEACRRDVMAGSLRSWLQGDSRARLDNEEAE